EVPRPAVRRPAAAGGDRALPRHAAQGDALRRADLGARPRDGQRGPRRHDRPGPRGHDDDRRDPRDGLRAQGGAEGRVHGGRPDRGGEHARRVLHQRAHRAREGLPLEDPHALTAFLRHIRNMTAGSAEDDNGPLSHGAPAESRGRTKMRARRFGALIGAGLALSLALTPCGSDTERTEAKTVLQKAKEDKKLTIGIKFDQPALGLKKPDGSFEGFDVDVAKYIAKELGVPEDGITFKETTSANRESFIGGGQVDLVI